MSDPKTSEPRVLRKVTRFDRKGCPKQVVDKRLGLKLEKKMAQVQHTCENLKCPHSRVIQESGPYITVDDGTRRRIGRQMIPVLKEYHPNCLPKQLHPCLRFFDQECSRAK